MNIFSSVSGSVFNSVRFRGILFPHIPRKFTAALSWYTEKIVLWTVLAALLTINIYARVNLVPSHANSLTSALVSPFTTAVHEALAKSYWQEGLLGQAKQELLYAQSLGTKSNTQVLGATTGSSDLLSLWENEPNRLSSELAYWQSVVKEKPDYRDAYLIMASLAYQLGSFDEVKTYLGQAQLLDPNSVIPKELLNP